MKKYCLYIFLFLLSILTFISCSKDDELGTSERFPDSNHTLLLYMIGDNKLGRQNTEKTDTAYSTKSVLECINGLLKAESPINLLIYEDSDVSGDGGEPLLYRLKRNNYDESKIDTLMIHKWESDHNSVDPLIMRNTIKEVFSLYPSSINGLCIWGLGDGWYPSFNYKYNNTKSIGDDRLNRIEIWELRRVLEQVIHFDYLIFDLPYMSHAEIAYELRNCTDYILGYPTDVMMKGLPYEDVIKSLSKAHHKESIEKSLCAIVEAFSNYYQGSKNKDGSIALLDLKKIGILKEKYNNLLLNSQEILKEISWNFYYYRNSLNPIGQKTKDEEFFYDFLYIVNYFIKNNNINEDIEFDDFVNLINEIVIKEYHTKFFQDINIENSCGLGICIPEILNSPVKVKAYKELQWCK